MDEDNFAIKKIRKKNIWGGPPNHRTWPKSKKIFSNIVYSDTSKVTILWHLDVTDTRHNQLRILYSGGVRRMVEGCRYGIFPTINTLVTMHWLRSIIWPRGIVYISFHEWSAWTLWSLNQAGTLHDIVTHHRSNSEQHKSCSSHWTNILTDKWLMP